MTGIEMMEMAKSQREAKGLKLSWTLPDGQTFTAYAKDEAQKAVWLAGAEAKGWKLEG